MKKDTPTLANQFGALAEKDIDVHMINAESTEISIQKMHSNQNMEEDEPHSYEETMEDLVPGAITARAIEDARNSSPKSTNTVSAMITNTHGVEGTYFPNC